MKRGQEVSGEALQRLIDAPYPRVKLDLEEWDEQPSPSIRRYRINADGQTELVSPDT